MLTKNEFFFCCDPHGTFDHIIYAVLEHRPAAVILLGDQQIGRSPSTISSPRIMIGL